MTPLDNLIQSVPVIERPDVDLVRKAEAKRNILLSQLLKIEKKRVKGVQDVLTKQETVS